MRICPRCWGTGVEPTTVTSVKYKCRDCRGSGTSDCKGIPMLPKLVFALYAIVACLCACPTAEACPLGQRIGNVAKAPLKVLKARPLRGGLGRLLGR